MHSVLQRLRETFNLFDVIADMRKQRIAMVQTKDQYILIHRAVKDLFNEQLKMIETHPYENIDFNGEPLMGKEKGSGSGSACGSLSTTSSSLPSPPQISGERGVYCKNILIIQCSVRVCQIALINWGTKDFQRCNSTDVRLRASVAPRSRPSCLFKVYMLE